MKNLLLVLTVIVLFPLTSLAWDREGHQAVAAIAYAQLSPTQRSAVDDILKNHPWYDTTWRTEYQQSHPTGMSFEQFAFVRAAAWPDDIRGNPTFHHATWHYVNFPVTLPNSVNTDSPIGGDLMTQIPACMNSVQHDMSASQKTDRAIKLSWLLHLVGDLHQPLHTVALVNNIYPQGDHGGNSFFVRFTANAGATLVSRLHSINEIDKSRIRA